MVVSQEEEKLTKIYIDLPDDAPVGGESFWANPLGDDTYELRNSPWYAYDLHFGDVVRAVPDEPGMKPRIVEVVRRSGHKTLRVLFDKAIHEADQIILLLQLNRWKAFHEHATGCLWAVDVEPDGDYQAVCDQLWEWEQAGKLAYETGTT